MEGGRGGGCGCGCAGDEPSTPSRRADRPSFPPPGRSLRAPAAGGRAPLAADDRLGFFGRTSKAALRRAARKTAALAGVAVPRRWSALVSPFDPAPRRPSAAQILAKKPGPGGPPAVADEPGLQSDADFTVWIGDAKFVVPKHFYYANEYRRVLPTEDDALEYIWPIQTLYRATKGLTGEQIDGLWGCIDLKPDEGWFFKEVDSNGIGGYAGRTFYWATQYLAMFWEYTREGEVVDGKDSPCKGIADARDVLLAEGLKVPRWHVLGSGDGAASTYFYSYPDRAGCLSTKDLGTVAKRPCSDIVWNDGTGADPVLNNSNDYELTFRTPDDGVTSVERRIDSAGTDTEQILYYGTELRADRIDEDTPGSHGAYVPDQADCFLVAKARTVGWTGLVADAYLHWAHVAAALALSCESYAAIHYLECALILGRYAANEIVGYAKLIAHELAHRYTEGISHFDGDCCMCTIAESWASGVRALLGLPDSSDGVEYPADDELFAYPTFVLKREVGCSNDGDTTPLFSWYTWYATPGESYGTRGFAAFDTGSKKVRASVVVTHV